MSCRRGSGTSRAARRAIDSLEPRRLLATAGLKGFYFNTFDTQGPALRRVDPAINFEWAGSPIAGVNADFFSVIWTGRLKVPVSGAYTFHYTTNALGRLWLNNQNLVNRWSWHEDTTDTFSITLVAGQEYEFRADVGDNTGVAKAKLEWTKPGAAAKEVVPASAFFQSDEPRARPYSDISPGEAWLDTSGQFINAHGGSMLFHKGVYYWYGEHRRADASLATTNTDGIAVYSSIDLMNWKKSGLALTAGFAAGSGNSADLALGRVIERPRVIYNDLTKQFVMWMHIDSPNYSDARAGVAVSSSPTGPFTYVGATRPLGFDSRDLTVFKDPDNGKAFLVFASNVNTVLRIVELDANYTGFTGQNSVFQASNQREAPAIVKYNGRYNMITSGAHGWGTGSSQYHWATSMLGPWTHGTNPMTGPLAGNSNNAQISSLFAVGGKPGTFIAMMDRWRPWDITDSRYVWLPVTYVNNALVVAPMQNWSISNFAPAPPPQKAPTPPRPKFTSWMTTVLVPFLFGKTSPFSSTVIAVR